MTTTSEALRAHLRGQQAAMVEALSALVAVESPSNDLAATARCATAVGDLGEQLLGSAPERLTVDGRSHLRWRFGRGDRVALVGHLDTVWPLGTTARWPFTVTSGTATGPGAFDMKAGIVIALHALAACDDLDGVEVLITSDEEIGSPSSRDLVIATAQRVAAALVLEPSGPQGQLKTARKGVGWYALTVTGRAAHAGLEPLRGVNALVELSHHVLALHGLNRPDRGTSVTPTVAAAGSVTNVVPAAASVSVDVRTATVAEQDRIDAEIRGLRPVLPGAALALDGGPNRPPLQEEAALGLYERAREVAIALGLEPPASVHVGGASDANLIAGAGTPVLDGLGALGDGAHAEGEHVTVGALADRAALVSALVTELVHTP